MESVIVPPFGLRKLRVRPRAARLRMKFPAMMRQSPTPAKTKGSDLRPTNTCATKPFAREVERCSNIVVPFGF